MAGAIATVKSVDIADDEGVILGVRALVLVRTGPFTGEDIVCNVVQDLRNEAIVLPVVGSTVFVDIDDSGVGYILGRIPGGEDNPIPKSAAGVATTLDALSTTQVIEPPKGVGIRNYIRGAPYVIRLKGTQEGYCGELYIETDDQADSPDGKNGSFIRIVRDPTTGKFAIKLRDATGASITILDGIIVLQSPNGENAIRVGDDGIFLSGTDIGISASNTLSLQGGIYMNATDPLSAQPAIRGTSGQTGIPSLSVFIGSLAMASVQITLPTPCGDVTVKQNLPFPALNLPLPPPFPNLNLKLWIPLPDCSLLAHTGSAPEPPEDSKP